MLARLVPLEEGPLISLDRPIILIGRDADCDVRIDSRKVSRRHCCVLLLEDKLVIRDLGSTNGVRQNGKKIQEGTLHPNDEIVLGHLRYQVVVENGRAAPLSELPSDADDSEP